MIFRAIAAIVLAGAAPFLGCFAQPEARKSVIGGPLPRITVPFLGMTRDVKGIEMPDAVHRAGVNGFDVLEPCDLTIEVPGRRSIRLQTVKTTILAMDGVIDGVYIWRPLQPASFKLVIADLLRTLSDQGLSPGTLMKRHLRAWPDDLPDAKGGLFPIPYKTAINNALGEIGGVHIQVTTAADGGWFYMWEVGTNIKATYATQIVDPQSPKQAVAVQGPNAGRLTGEPASIEERVSLHGASVHLPGSSRDVNGLGVPPDLLAGKPGVAKLPRPHAITIERPHAKPLSLLARQTSLEIANGEVKSVTLLRPLLPCYFEKALADITDAVQAEDADPAPLKALTAGWSEKPGPQEFSTDIRGVFEELEAHVHMTKDVATSGWSYEMTFRYTGPPVDLAGLKSHEPVTTPSEAAPAQEPSKPTNPARPLQGQLRTGLPAISLHVPGTARQVTGLDLPADALSGKPAQASISSPHYLTIDRSNGKPLWLPARETTVAIRENHVESVTIGRPILPLPLDAAVTDLRNTAKTLGIEPKEIEIRTAGWMDKAGSDEFSASVAGEPEGLDSEIRMKKTAELGGGWWYEMTFRASKLPASARQKAASEPPPPPVPQVSVRMLAPAEEIMGMDLPRDLAQQKETRLLITRTTDVTVRLPGNKTFRQRVKAGEIYVRQGEVFMVFLTPQVLATNYREIVAELVWVSNANAIAPKGQVNQQVARWPAETDRSVRRASEWLNERLRFVIAMLPKDDGKWRPVFAFVAADEAPGAAPSSQPVRKAPAAYDNGE
jgi:hypothetical protein